MNPFKRLAIKRLSNHGLLPVRGAQTRRDAQPATGLGDQQQPGLLQRLRPYVTDLAAFATALCTAALAALLLGSLHGCGGGVGGEGTGSFASGTFASGPISGFGSIVVNGVRFDDSSASVLDDDGLPINRSLLALGAVVQVNGSAVTLAADGSQVATATQVQINRSLVGPATSLNPGAGTLVVLGQPVRTTANTVFDTGIVGGLAGIAQGRTLEVYGAYDASTSGYLATRIALASSSTTLRVRGPVSALNTSAKTFRIGSQTYSYANQTQTAALADGAVVQVAVGARTDAQGRWVVATTPTANTKPASGESIELHGVVASVLSPTRFVLEGLTVDTASVAGGVVVQVGTQVEVSGKVQGSVLVANKVKFENDSDERDFELRGNITAIDTVNKRFVVRGTTVSYAGGGIEYDDGSEADLAVGRAVKVEGRLASDGTLLQAFQIEFD